MAPASPWFLPQALSIITTHRCTAACEHCCFACTPQVDRAIPVPRLRALIEEAAAIPSIRLIVFTGGECFLLGPELDRLLARCTSHGLRTRCVTNGSWAGSPSAARRRVARLREAGLGELNFSTGPIHARYVPVQRVLWGAHAAAAAGLRVLVNIETFAGSGFDPEALARHPLIDGFRRTGRIQVNEGSWMPNGSEIEGCASQGRSAAPGFPLRHESGHLRFHSAETRTACTSSLTTLSVTPDQDLVSCCGLTLEHIPELHVGNLRDKTLAAAIAGIAPDLLKMWLHTEGPERILEFLRSKDAGLELPLDSAHICHTCRYLHASARAMELLREHAAQAQERILESYFLTAASLKLAAESGGAVPFQDHLRG